MDEQRCNYCGAVFDEELTACPNCGRDYCLMYPFDIPLCPSCNGERESAGTPGRYNCHFCGLMGSP